MSTTTPTNQLPQLKQNNAHKFLVVGSPDSGKTTIMDYYSDLLQGPKKVQRTVGCDVHVKEITKGNSTQYMEFWDLSGEIKFQPQVKVYTQAQDNSINAFKGIIFFFDLDNIKTLFNINKYLKELAPHAPQSQDQAQIPLLIVGNKLDLIKQKDRKSKFETINEYLNYIFDYNPKLKYTFVSKESTSEDFKELDMFLEDCIEKRFENLNMFDPSQELYSHDKYLHYTMKTLQSLGKDLRRVQSMISMKTNPLHVYAVGAFLTLTLSINVLCYN